LAEGPGQRAHRRVGTMVRDKYRIDAFIATGSMANVYAATHRNGSRVALKILHRELAKDPAMAERFRREGYFANAIGHAGVVRAIDDDLAEDGCAFIVMELLEGENLEDRRKRMGGRMSLPEVLRIADAMLDVLAAAHDHEILHRDLKPENVYVTRKNEVKLLDFGVARFNDGRSSSDMTAIGMVLGTPAFMPPEQALGRREEVDARSDIWGVGATLFMVLTGESVHVGGDAKSKLIATARTQARSLREVLPATPRAVASVIDRALAFDKAERWADAGAMREALRWARMTLDNGRDAASPDHAKGESIADPAPTLRGDEDSPTLAGRSPLESFDDEEESTEKRHKPGSLSDAPARPAAGRMVRRKAVSVDGVFTSAPPVTQKEMPPAMAMSEDPTFSLRADPVFSLRRNNESTKPPARREGELSPITERIPQQAGYQTPNRMDAVTEVRPAVKDFGERPTAPDADAIFRQAYADASNAATAPRFEPRQGEERPAPRPRPAAGAPPDSVRPPRDVPPDPRPPAIRTAPGIGQIDSAAADVVLANAGRTTAQMSSAHPPPEFRVSHDAPEFPAPEPRPDPSVPPMQIAKTIPATTVRTDPALRSSPARPSLTPENPGPLLATIAPKRRSRLLRVIVPVSIGILTGIATYTVVVYQRAASASHAAPHDSNAPPPSAAVSTVPSGAASVAAPSPSMSVPPIIAGGPTPPPPIASSAPAVASAPAPKRRPRPRPKPAAPSTATTTAPPETATAEPPSPPTPTPTPAPTPQDALPRKEDN
jgi:serine/threonine protein kinase